MIQRRFGMLLAALAAAQAVGYSGHIIMGSPAGSRRLAVLITGRAADADNPFSTERFARG